MEHINELDHDDLEEYKELLEQKTRLEMNLITFQKYLEDKYLAGMEVDDGSVYLDAGEGLLYFWLDK